MESEKKQPENSEAVLPIGLKNSQRSQSQGLLPQLDYGNARYVVKNPKYNLDLAETTSNIKSSQSLSKNLSPRNVLLGMHLKTKSNQSSRTTRNVTIKTERDFDLKPIKEEKGNKVIKKVQILKSAKNLRSRSELKQNLVTIGQNDSDQKSCMLPELKSNSSRRDSTQSKHLQNFKKFNSNLGISNKSSRN